MEFFGIPCSDLAGFGEIWSFLEKFGVSWRLDLPSLPAPAAPVKARASLSDQDFENGRAPVHLSHAGPDQDLARRQEGAGEHQSLLLSRTPRSACSASTARASRRCCASWPASTRNSPARAWSPRARGSAICRRSRSSIRDPRRQGQRHARRRGQAGDPRPLQRTRDELFRRDRGRDDPSAGRDRGARASGTSTARSSRRWTRWAARPTTPTSTKLSGGERRRVALCRLLLEKPELLLLDEPTNHLDAETVNWLEGHLRNYPGAILIVTHDRYFLDNVTGWILELDRGRGIPYEGNYSSWLKQKQKRLEQEGREDDARQRALAEESEWIAASPQGAAGQVQGAHRRPTRSWSTKQNEKAPTTAQIVIPVAERLGNNVIDFDGLSKGYRRPAADRQAVVQAAARRHRRRDRPERRRQDDAVPHDHRPGKARLAARSRSARRCSSAMSTSRATRSTPRRPSGRKSPAATTSSISASAR